MKSILSYLGASLSISTIAATIFLTTQSETAVAQGTSIIYETKLGSLRSDFTGYVGMQIQVGSRPLLVHSLGRMVAPGNKAAPNMALIDPETGFAVPGSEYQNPNYAEGSVGQYKYTKLAAPITLTPFKLYYLISYETKGDSWYEADSKVTPVPDAFVTGGVYYVQNQDGSFNAPVPWPSNSVNQMNTPLSFEYEILSLPVPPTGLSYYCVYSNYDRSYSVNITWDNVNGASDYLFRMDDTTNSWYDAVTDVMIQTSSRYFSKKVVSGRQYNVWVHGNNMLGIGSASAISVKCGR